MKIFSRKKRYDYIIVGLGNPGSEYAGTKHNVGFDAVEKLRRAYGAARWRRDTRSKVCDAVIDGHSVLLVMPQTYMNNSGAAVAALCGAYRVPPERLVVIYDDFAFECGVLRVSKSGSGGSHNGVKDIVARLGTQGFARLRIGIGKPVGDTAEYVLSPFGYDERGAVNAAIEACVERAREVVAGKV